MEDCLTETYGEERSGNWVWIAWIRGERDNYCIQLRIGGI